MPLKFITRLLENEKNEETKLPELADVVEKARQEWVAAQHYYNSVADNDLIDHAVYMLQASEKKYMYLMKQARQAGITHSPYQVASTNTLTGIKDESES